MSPRPLDSRRILLTGLSTYWGGRLAQALERDDAVETIIGIDRTPPKVALERTEYVEVADSHSLVRRIVQAAEIDTVVDTRLVVDSLTTSPRKAHENNVIGTMNILAGCGGPDSTVRKVVFKSSGHFYGCHQDDPAFFTEAMERPHPAQTPIERDIVEAEKAVRDFAVHHPQTSVTVLRFANGLGPDIKSSHARLLDLPAVPAILGFDPRYQFIGADDIANALEHAVRHDLPGVFNAAADGVLALSEVAGLLGKPLAPVISPVATGFVLGRLRRLGLLRVPPEMVAQLRFGRALDNRRLKATGFRFRQTTRETVLELRRHQRLSPLHRSEAGAYRYEREIEEFLRYSPSVRRTGVRPSAPENVAPGTPKAPAAVGAPAGYDTLEAAEVIALLASLEPGDLERLREHESAHRDRRDVIVAIDSVLVRARAG